MPFLPHPVVFDKLTNGQSVMHYNYVTTLQTYVTALTYALTND